MIKIVLLLFFIGCACAVPVKFGGFSNIITTEPTTPNTTTTVIANSSINFKVVLRDFTHLIPFDKIAALSQSLANDTEFQAAINYLASPEWRTIVDLFAAYPPVTEVWSVLRSLGVPMQIQDILCREKTGEPNNPNADQSLRKYIEGLNELLPYDNLKLMFEFKMDSDKNFQKFHTIVSSERMENLSRDIVKSDQFLRVAFELYRLNVPINSVLALIYEYMGWRNTPQLYFLSLNLFSKVFKRLFN